MATSIEVLGRERMSARAIYRTIPKVRLPEGSSRAWRVERFTVSQEQHAAMRASAFVVCIQGVPRYYWHDAPRTPPGTYTRLLRNGQVIMADTPSEMADHVAFVRAARGRVLISGLGLGAALQACLRKPEVEHVTVVELSADVITLVGAHYLRRYSEERLTIVHANALNYHPRPGEHFEAVWHDIWDDIDPRNLPQMRMLQQAYAGHCDWQESWTHRICERLIAGGWGASSQTIRLDAFPQDALQHIEQECESLVGM